MEEQGEPGGAPPGVELTSLSDASVQSILAMVSHELRTPLQSIMTNVEVMGLMPLPEDARQALQRLELSVDLVLERLNSLSVSLRSAARAGSKERRQVFLAPFLVSLTQEFAPEATLRGQELAVELHPAVQQDLEVDVPRLQGILAEFLRNAMRHGEQGIITLGAAPVPLQETARQPAIEFCVANPGPGIPPADREAIWQPFVRRPTGPRRAKGMGLGLAVAKLLGASAGWEVGMREPLEGQNTFFYVRVPATTA